MALDPIVFTEKVVRSLRRTCVGGRSSRSSSSTRLRRGVDFARIDADNRRLGLLGEEWTLEFERRRLHDVERRPDLAKRIVWVSDLEGDGAGFDIRRSTATRRTGSSRSRRRVWGSTIRST
jgi:hypothetical protein